jgi:hypothetical protein
VATGAEAIGVVAATPAPDVLDGAGRVTCAEAGLAPTGGATVGAAGRGGVATGGPSAVAGICGDATPVEGPRSEAMGGAGATGPADMASALGDVLAQAAVAATSAATANRATLGKTRQVMEVAMIHRPRAGGETGLGRHTSRVIVSTDVHGS